LYLTRSIARMGSAAVVLTIVGIVQAPWDDGVWKSGDSHLTTPTACTDPLGEVSSSVTEVKLTLADLRRTEVLPAVCVRCGSKAAGFRGTRLTTSEPNHPSTWGWILWELGLWTLEEKASFENLLHELRITKGRLKLPVCWWHRWIVPPGIGVRLVDDRTVVLYRVSDASINAMKKRGWVR
jgi:hypothetical protein